MSREDAEGFGGCLVILAWLAFMVAVRGFVGAVILTLLASGCCSQPPRAKVDAQRAMIASIVSVALTPGPRTQEQLVRIKIDGTILDQNELELWER